MKNLDIKKFIMTSLLLVTSSLFSMMPYYQNKVVQVQEIHGATTYTIMLKCSSQEPIIVYAPASYQESLNSSQIRFFLPNTSFDENLENNLESLKVMGNGIEILLFGDLVKKIVSDGIISLTVKVK